MPLLPTACPLPPNRHRLGVPALEPLEELDVLHLLPGGTGGVHAGQGDAGLVAVDKVFTSVIHWKAEAVQQLTVS